MAENQSFWCALAPIKRAIFAPISLLLVAATLVVLAPPEITNKASASSYSFLSHTFTPCGATGQNGPTLANCQSAYSSASWAQSTSNLNVVGGIQQWTVPVTGLYEITAAGAIGGGGNASSGRIVRGRSILNEGTVIKILVGQSGIVGTANSYTGGGGGGSFVTTSANSALLIAGGGGGSGNSGSSTSTPGQTTTCGQTGAGSGGAGGCSGNGGSGSTFGGGGGGLNSNGTTKTYDNGGNNGGKAFVNGGTGGSGGAAGGYAGGAHGGFGGGAGSCSCSTGGGGGAGGYSGGGGGGTGYSNGGGGGSYVDASFSSVNTNVGLNAATGYVTIEIVAPVVSSFQPSVSSPSNATSLNYTIQLSENVTGFDVSDVSLSGTSSTWSISSFSGSGDTYQLALTSTNTTSGTLIVSVAQNSFTGVSSSMLGPPAPSASPTMNIDVDPPGASVASAPSSPAAAMSLTFGVTFTESVSGIAAGDFSNAGTAAGCVFTPSTSSGSSVNVVVTQCQEGTLQLQLAQGAVVDAAGNTGPTTAVTSSLITLAASPLSVTVATQTLNFGGSWTDSYTQSGLLGSDTVSLTYSYSGTTNDGVSYGPSGTKPTQAGLYSIIPTVSYGVGNTNRYALTVTNGSLTIGRVAQSALSVATTAMTYGQTLSLTTTGGSGTGVVSWQVVSGSCTLAGSSLTPGNAGSSCVVKATKAQDNNYTVVSTADTTMTIGRAAQSSLSVSTTSTSYGNDLVLGTSGGSGTGNVSWQVISGTCSVSGALLTPGNAGSSCVVKATKAQDTNYTVISSADTTITINKASQIGFSVTNASSFTTGQTLALVASGGQSGGSISWQVTAGICSLSGTSLTASRGGVSCTVEATRAGSTNYLAATDTMVVTVDKIVQVLTFQSTPPSSPLVGGTYTVSVTSDASLAPTITIANSSSQVCTISAGVVSFIAAGTCTVSAVQAGNDQVAAAAASQQISVSTVPTTTTTTVAPVQGGQTPSVSTTTTTVAPGGVAANTTPSTTTTSTTTTTTTTSTTIPELGRGGVTEVDAGEATATVQGKLVKVSVETVEGEIVVRLPNDVRVKVGTPKGVVTGAVVNSDGVLVAYNDDQFQVEADGFATGSTYVVTMYSDPTELGRGEIGTSGSVTDVVRVPKDVKAGEHTLVFEGVGENAEVVAVSLGFKVVERSDNTMAAVLAVSIAILLALLGGRPIWRRRKNRTA